MCDVNLLGNSPYFPAPGTNGDLHGLCWQRSNDEGRKVLCHSLSEGSWQSVGLRCWAQTNGETCKHLAARNSVLAGPDVFSAPTLSVTLLPLYDMNSITRITVCLIIQGALQRSRDPSQGTPSLAPGKGRHV